MKTKFSILSLLLFFAVSSFAQYAKVTIDSKVPFRLEADGKAVHEGHATSLKLRLNKGETYRLVFFDKKNNQQIFAKDLVVAQKLKSAKYMIKYRKKKDRYLWITKAENFPNQGGGGISFSAETRESYSGPDGAYSKSSKTEGNMGKNGLNYKNQKNNASVDEKGLNAESKSKEGSMPTLGSVGKIFKKKKKEDGRRIVVLKIKR